MQINARLVKTKTETRNMRHGGCTASKEIEKKNLAYRSTAQSCLQLAIKLENNIIEQENMLTLTAERNI